MTKLGGVDSLSIGIDLGSDSSTIALCHSNHGIDILCNEVSNRSTPTLISFSHSPTKNQQDENANESFSSGHGKRLVGEAAKSQQISNIGRTAQNLKHNDQKGHVMAGFSQTQLLAMFLGHLHNKIISKAALSLNNNNSSNGGNVKMECVIGVPVFFTDAQRRSIRDAAWIAGFTNVALISEGLAAVLEWAHSRPADYFLDLQKTAFHNNSIHGNGKNPLKKAKGTHLLKEVCVAIVAIGKMSTQVTIAAVKDVHNIQVKAVAWDDDLGGAKIDDALKEHFLSSTSHKNPGRKIKSDPKTDLRINTACERVKRILSANTRAMLTVENVFQDDYEDTDAHLEVSRETLEGLLVKRSIDTKLKAVIQKTISGIKQHVNVVEIVGGATRLPFFKNIIASVFNLPINTTLNQDEAVARGAAFHAYNITSSQVKLSLQDLSPYPIKFVLNGSVIDGIPRYTPIPSSKLLKIAKLGDLKVFEVQEDGKEDFIGAIPEVKKGALRIAFDLQGLITVYDDDHNAEQMVLLLANSLTPEQLKAYRQTELALQRQDRLHENLAAARNTLEELLYTAKSFPIRPPNLPDIEAWLEAADNNCYPIEAYQERIQHLQSLIDRSKGKPSSSWCSIQ